MAISGVADLTGRVLAGRYRLLAPIGAGASGRVYVADDVRLKRRVGVKVLHLALAEDAGFLRRFRAEAQVAASLNHPNVMAVYDWGEDDVPFMVLELLTGGSLRGLLDAEARLSPSQAAHVGRQVTQRIGVRTRAGVVHRDIKPANLLFDEHGIARVADFGLAGALAEASWTEPAGAVVGTARYAAPEQATGAPLDGRADLYSLAVVLVEAVTGTVPAVADTASARWRHVRTPHSVAPLALGRLGPVVERAGRPDPAERYPDAATMRAALADAAARAAATAAAAARRVSGVRSMVASPRGSAAGRTSSIRTHPPPIRRPPRRCPRSHRPKPAAAPRARFGALDLGGSARSDTPGVDRRRRRPRRGDLGVHRRGAVVGRAQHEIGDRQGGGRRAHAAHHRADGRRSQGHGDRSASGAGLVHQRQRIGGARRVARPATGAGRRRSTVSRPPTRRPRWSTSGFAVNVKHQYDEIRSGRRRHRHGSRGRHQRAARLHAPALVSDGPAPVPVPDVGGKSFDDASQALTAAGFAVARADDFDATIAAGKVIRTDPAANQPASRGAQITIHVSKGPETVKVPNLVGQSLDAATQQLQAAGFQVDTQSYLPGRVVRAQDPAAGTTVNKGTKVTLFF